MCKHLTSRSTWNLEVLVSMEGGKPENPEKPSEPRENQQQTQLTCQPLEPNSGHRGGRRVLSPLRQSCFLVLCDGFDEEEQHKADLMNRNSTKQLLCRFSLLLFSYSPLKRAPAFLSPAFSAGLLDVSQVAQGW